MKKPWQCESGFGDFGACSARDMSIYVYTQTYMCMYRCEYVYACRSWGQHSLQGIRLGLDGILSTGLLGSIYGVLTMADIHIYIYTSI